MTCRARYVLALSLAGHMLVPASSRAVDYYLSSKEGNDANAGSMSSPWKSLDRISSAKLGPGDTVCFKRGDRFVGRFVVNGSGTERKPIRITSYGEGPPPILAGEVGAEGGGDFQEAVYVHNQDNLVFEGLEIRNERKVSRSGVDDGDAYGLHVHNTGDRVMKNIILRNMDFRKVYAVKPVLERADFDGLEVAAVRFHTSKTRKQGPQRNIQNILVEGSRFEDIQRLGIHIKHDGSENEKYDDPINFNAEIIVRNNEFHHLGGTSVLPIRTYDCLIENNLFNHPGSSVDPRMPGRGSSVWTWRCMNTVIQKNRCIGTRGYLDSHGIHIDHENINTFVQYNYMEDCEGGFVEILGGNSNAVYRFNVSVNDGWRENPTWTNSNHTIWINQIGAGKKVNLSTHSYIYNNTVYMDRDYKTAIEINAKNTFIFNNLFVSTGNGVIGGKAVRVESNGSPLHMNNNLFQGAVDQRFVKLDVSPVFGDPQFTNRGEGAERFRLEPRSPALNAGVAMAGPPIPGAGKGVFKNLTPYPTEDFFGNPLNLAPKSPLVGAVGEAFSSHSTVPHREIPPAVHTGALLDDFHLQWGRMERETR